MSFPEIIDLHMHSTASDGTDTPAEIVGKVREAGIGLFSVTDHDGIAGAVEVERILENEKEEPLLFVKGIEFSCKDDGGKYHILGYNYDKDNETLNRVVQLAHENRLNKVMLRLDFLKTEFGFDFRQEDIDALLKNNNPGKPHIANMMIQYGYADSIQGAMKDYLNKKKFPNAYISPETAIQTILESGGVPVLAHPSYGDGSQLIVGEEMKERLNRLLDYGLQGLEGYYSGFSPKLIHEILLLAEKNDLYVTAGSDYHGKNKLVTLGDTNLDALSEGCTGLKRFLERVFPA